MSNFINKKYQVAIIGAGPSGTCAASLLHKLGLKVVVFERDTFPRFSIGESLLPQCIDDLKEADLLDGVQLQNYQLKDGAGFLRGEQYIDFNFSKKFSNGADFAYQVKRDSFDHNLAQQCTEKGVPIFYNSQVNNVKFVGKVPFVSVSDRNTNVKSEYKVDFIIDASGYGRVLPKLLKQVEPGKSPNRFSLFAHLKDDCSSKIDRNKILIVVNEKYKDLWYWVIPFSDGTVSIGAVGGERHLDESLSNEELFIKILDDCSGILTRVDYKTQMSTKVQKIKGYSYGVKSLHGNSYVLLGNAGEFIDPVFSSGVTIALRSACLAAPLVAQQLRGGSVNWQKDYSDKLSQGVDVFRAFVDIWYQGELMDVFLANDSNVKIKEMVCSILAGFAWDDKNPIVRNTQRRLNALVEWVKLSKPLN